MLRRLALSAATGLMLALPALAETVSDFRLPNGLEVVVIEDHRAPVVTHMVWYRVGAADEPPGHSGIAHFLEHLMFKGTDEMSAGEFSATVEAQGGDDNAFTSWDYTAYFQRVAADRLDLMMKMEADRMRDLQMTEEDVRTERQVVLEERSQRTDSDPGAVFSEQSRAAAYLNHPYGIPIIGWRHEIEQLGREDAFSFYRTYYAPNNAILVVAGDVDPAEVRRMAEEHYGALEPTPNLPERLRPQEPPQLAERRLTFSDPRVAQPYVSRSYLAATRETGAQEKAAALTILAELLGGSPTTLASVARVAVRARAQGGLGAGLLRRGRARFGHLRPRGRAGRGRLAAGGRGCDGCRRRALPEGRPRRRGFRADQDPARRAGHLLARQCGRARPPLRCRPHDGADGGRCAGLARSASGRDARRG